VEPTEHILKVVGSLPDDAKGALTAAGWFPGRDVDPGRWHTVLGREGFVLRELTSAAVAGFGGLRVVPAVMNGAFRNAPILFEPELAGSGSLDIAHELRDEFGQDFYPIAEWITNGCVYLGSAGKVVVYHDTELLLVAESFGVALRVMLTADQALPVLKVY
jgi:hypothetical protein